RDPHARSRDRGQRDLLEHDGRLAAATRNEPARRLRQPEPRPAARADLQAHAPDAAGRARAGREALRPAGPTAAVARGRPAAQNRGVARSPTAKARPWAGRPDRSAYSASVR